MSEGVWQGLRRENSEQGCPKPRACLDRARESVESSVAAWKLGEYRVQVSEAARVSIVPYRTGTGPQEK